jgi:hypothetical protein
MRRLWPRRLALAGLITGTTAVLAFPLVFPGPASATTSLTVPSVGRSTVLTADMDCKESPTPDQPGQGLAAFFGPEPDVLPPEEDPFADDASTTVYEQYGFAGLRWNTYDLGCGPDAAREPDAVIGTSVGNWIMNLPVGLSALTASLTEVAFQPTFLQIFDPLLTRVSDVLHSRLFERWAPVVLTVLGMVLLVKARGMAMATAAGAVLWSLFVIMVAAALFRWPVEAGRLADDTVTHTLGGVVQGLNGGAGTDAATAVASSLQSSVLYPAWLAGQLGSTDSATATKYGPALFKATTLTWREAQVVQDDPEAGRKIIDDKRDAFGDLADQVRKDDPAAYQFLTGQRSDTRVAYAMLAALATVLALPFLLVSCLMLLGSFFVVRLAVMLFPAFATLGLFPAARGIVIGVGRTVGAAVINAVIFGAGAALTVAVLGVILDPSSRLPLWLTLVLLPLFSLIMWLTLKPFRRLTAMAPGHNNPFGDGAGALGTTSRATARMAQKAAAGLAAAYTAGTAAGVTAAAATANSDDEDTQPVPDRAESRSDHTPTPTTVAVGAPALEPASSGRPMSPSPGAAPGPEAAGPLGRHGPASHPMPEPGRPDRNGDPTTPWPDQREPWRPAADSAGHRTGGGRGGTVVAPDGTLVEDPGIDVNPLFPTAPDRTDGEEVYPIYRPSDDAHEPA